MRAVVTGAVPLRAVLPWNVLHAVASIASTDETRPEICCVAIQRLKEHPQHGFVAATTGYILLAVRLGLEDWNLEPGETILVPPNFLPPKKTFDNEEMMTIEQDEGETSLRASAENYRIGTKTPENLAYPNWERLIPASDTAEECGHFGVEIMFLEKIRRAFGAILGNRFRTGTEIYLTQKGLGPLIVHAQGYGTDHILGLVMPRKVEGPDVTPSKALSKLYRNFWVGTE